MFGLAIYATRTSLESVACREEYNIALTRAVGARGQTFPVFGLFPEDFDPALIPLSLQSRLAVSTADPNWKERVSAATEGRAPSISRDPLDRFHPTMHAGDDGHSILELRVRAGRVHPVVIGVPLDQREAIDSWPGPSGHPRRPLMLATSSGEGDGLAVTVLHEPITPTTSLYIRFNKIPRQIQIGEVPAGSGPMTQVQWLLTLQSFDIVPAPHAG